MFKIEKTFIDGLVVIEPQVYGDDRGFFMESWNKRDFEKIGMDTEFVQDNHSKSQKGVLRGIHFQTSHSQGKLVRVISGSVFDVAVDLRSGSNTYGKHFGIILSADNKKMFYIPENFGHGFVALSNDTEFLYKTTDYYYPEYDSGIIWNDKDLNIQWPLKEYDIEEPLLSEKDKNLMRFKD